MLARILLLMSIPALTGAHSTNAKLLLISLDGFRHDYFEIAKERGFSTPHLDKLRSQGVFAEVQDVFLTKTFACHYSIATGLYPENHGIIHNIFYDPVYNDTFESSKNKKEYKWFNGTKQTRLVEPIWITNQKAKHTIFPRWSGVYLWPGSEVAFQQDLPLHYAVWDKTTTHLPFDVRVRTIVNWFANEEAPINFGILYMPEPDHVGHYHGTHSNETLEKIEELDKGIGLLLSLLEEHHLLEHMNIIITSDHGMVNVEKDQIVYLNDHLDRNKYNLYGDNVAAFLMPQPNDEITRNEIFEKLHAVPGLDVYRKEDIPDRYHFKNNRRVLPILVVAKKGWLFADEKRDDKVFTVADHGYDNKLHEMHPFLIATGPAFKKNYTAYHLVQQVDLYEMMCHILGIEPNPNDGDLLRIEDLLETDEDEDEGGYTILILLAVIVFSALISGICCVAVCRVYRVNIRMRRRFLHLKDFPPNNRLNETSTTVLLAESDEEI